MSEPILRASMASGVAWDDPSEDMLFELLSDIEAGREQFMVVEQLGLSESYAQAILLEDGSWLMEYRAGSAEQHFVATSEDKRRIHAAMTGWAYSGSSNWRRTGKGTSFSSGRSRWSKTAFDGAQLSSRYPGGMALRFARVKRYGKTRAPRRRIRSPLSERCSQADRSSPTTRRRDAAGQGDGVLASTTWFSRSGRSVTMPSTPISRSRSISAGVLIVQQCTWAPARCAASTNRRSTVKPR